MLVMAAFLELALPAQLLPLRPVSIGALTLRLPAGFGISLFADAGLVQDAHCMTIDSFGRVVVGGPGYIKVLIDADFNGVAEAATLYATPEQTVYGMAADGPDLMAVADGWLLRFRDLNNDGVTDEEPARITALGVGELGGHSVMRGPDGFWYVLGGCQARITRQHATVPFTPLQDAEGGALLRLTYDGRDGEILADGFHNPRGLDFNWRGDFFICDDENEKFRYLPGHAPMRISQLAYGGHHGWRKTGEDGWLQPGYYPDMAEAAVALGGGISGGMVCYRHLQFPEAFHDGLFVADWAHGRVWFVALRPVGGRVEAVPEIFLEAVAPSGFAPNSLAVAPDGTLFVCTGGRGAQGGVYRIHYDGPDYVVRTNNFALITELPLARLLRQPQPMAAWSRAFWLPLARQIGEGPVGRVIGDEQWEPRARVRAIEILTEVFGGLTPREAAAGARSLSPEVRARTAWSLGRAPCEGAAGILLGLASDTHPLVRRCALEAVSDRLGIFGGFDLTQALAGALENPDKRVRLAGMRIARKFAQPQWRQLTNGLAGASVVARLAVAQAGIERQQAPGLKIGAVETALAAFRSSTEPAIRLEAVRLLMLAFGDWRLDAATNNCFAGYELKLPLTGWSAITARVREALRAAFPLNSEPLDMEVSRLLAMLEDDAPFLPAKVLSRITPQSDAASDVHYLTVLAKLRGRRTQDDTQRTAAALVGLVRKRPATEREQPAWDARRREITAALMARDASLAEALLRQPDFARPGQVPIAGLLNEVQQRRAAALFLQAMQRDSALMWPASLVPLLGMLPFESTAPVLYRQYQNNPAWRDELLLIFAKKPVPADRDKFIAGLDSFRREVTIACVQALKLLPQDQSPERMAALARLLQRLLDEPDQQDLRQEILGLLRRQMAALPAVEEKELSPPGLRAAYRPVFESLIRTYPRVGRIMYGEPNEDLARWERLLKTVAWGRGDAARGEEAFRTMKCAQCHWGPSSFGPYLGDAISQLSPPEFMIEVVFPSRKLAARHIATEFELRDGSIIRGKLIYNAPDMALVQTGPDMAVRLVASDIRREYPSRVSLMPAGLLSGVTPEVLADLYAYLAGPPPPAQPQRSGRERR